MSIRATGNNYTEAYSLYNNLFAKNSESANSSLAVANSAKTAGTSRLSGLLTTEGRAELGKALENMRKLGYDKMSFTEIEQYRKDLEKDFTTALKADLVEMGVDPEIKFTLVMDANGGVQVLSDHPDKALIEKYLGDNPEMVSTFKHVQALSNLKRSQQKASAQNHEFTRDLKLSLQAEAVQAFFATTDNGGQDYFSQIANFGSNDATSWLLGLNHSV